MVRIRGLEPPCPFEHMDLNHTRLPVPPYPPVSSEWTPLSSISRKRLISARSVIPPLQNRLAALDSILSYDIYYAAMLDSIFSCDALFIDYALLCTTLYVLFFEMSNFLHIIITILTVVVKFGHVVLDQNLGASHDILQMLLFPVQT